MPIVLNGTTGITTPTYNGSTTAEYLVPVTAFKNRIINGAMTIDQRNAGASVTFDGSNKYVTDRFYGFSNVGTTTSQQSTVAPSGFINSLLVTQSTGGSVVSGSYFALNQRIEGFNVADLGWGTANAATVTISFWVRSSVTGSYSVALLNSAGNRSYVTNYTINAANTWEQKTITVAGDTSGTWLTNNGIGVTLVWNLGYGSTYTTSTLNSWLGSGAYGSTTATTSFASTTGATFYITGVQLEVGSTATSFDYLDYGRSLIQCQRYYYKRQFTGGSRSISMLQAYGSSGVYGKLFDLPVTMRTTPTCTINSYSYFSFSDATSTPVAASAGGLTDTTADYVGTGSMTGSTGLVAGNASNFISISALGYIDASAEL